MYVILGASGHTGKEISKALLAAGKQVTVVGRSEANLADLLALGAKTAIGDLEDSDFLTKTFTGAEVAYLLSPPNWNPQPTWREAQRRVTHSVTNAVKASGLKKVVLLSSHGAHMPDGAGPVSGLHEFEEALKAVPGLDIKILRPGYFMENLFANIGMIKKMGILGSTMKSDLPFSFVHTQDIATVAIQHLLDLSFTGSSIHFIDGPRDVTYNEVTALIAKAINNPALTYVTFPKDQGKAGMMAAGLAETIADGYIDLLDAINSGEYFKNYVRTTESTTPTSVEWFITNQFVPAYQNA